MKKSKISGKELAWYIVGGIIALAGITLIITHIVGSLLTIPLSENLIYQAEVKMSGAVKFRLTFLTLGFVFLIIGVFALVMNLYHFAKKADAIREREIKRKQRLTDLMEQPQVVEVEAKDVEEVKTEEVKDDKAE